MMYVLNAGFSASSILKNLLDDLVELQTLLLSQNPDTRHVVDGTSISSKKYVAFYILLPDLCFKRVLV